MSRKPCRATARIGNNRQTLPSPSQIRRFIRLLRHGAPGREKPGFLDEDWRIGVLSATVSDLDVAPLAPDSAKSDWQGEPGIVNGGAARGVEERDALDPIPDYCLANGVCEREYQLERGESWDNGKSFDSFGPIGLHFVTSDEVGDPQALDMWLDINGGPMQTSSTRTRILGCATLVICISRIMTLFPGDVIANSAPPGVGVGRKSAPVYLKLGDVMTLGIEKLGRPRQRVGG
jgi:2,4-didehydro-3-deoxy-L-rhamnonate hydrolase